MDNKCCIIRKTSYILSSEYQEVAIGKVARAEAKLGTGRGASRIRDERGRRGRRGHDCMVEELERRR